MTENLSTFCRVFATQLSKWRSTFPRDKFEDNYFFENTVFVQHFRAKSVKFLAIWQKSLYRNAKTAVYVPFGTLRIEKFYLKDLFIFIIVFGHWVRNFWFFVEKFLPGLSKLQFTFWWESFVFAENDHIWSTSVIQRKVSTVCGKVLGRFVITTFYLSLGDFWGEDCFWGSF